MMFSVPFLIVLILPHPMSLKSLIAMEELFLNPMMRKFVGTAERAVYDNPSRYTFGA